MKKDQKQIMGYRLAMLRHHNGLSQKGLGKLIGATQKAISNWETGERWIPTPTILKICETLGADLEYFDPNKKGPEDNFPDKEIKDLLAAATST